MVSNLIQKILLGVAAVFGLLFTVNTKIESRRKGKEYEQTLEVADEIKSTQRSGNVRDRMSRNGWIKPD